MFHAVSFIAFLVGQTKFLSLFSSIIYSRKSSKTVTWRSPDNMTLPLWLEKPSKTEETAAPMPKIAFSDTRKLFAVDISGSTAGLILRQEQFCVETLAKNPDDLVCKWG